MTDQTWRAFLDWPRPARIATYAALALVLVLLAALLAAVDLVRRPFPQTTGRIDIPGLVHSVEVVRDDHGIPQLYGDSVADLMRAQGYVQAQERFFEMDVRRHATAGRLAELFGRRALASDEYVRTMGWRRVAERELALVTPETRSALQAYASGVNAYLDTHTPSEIAVEYTLLAAAGHDYEPEHWTPVDSIAWLKAMAWDLNGTMTDEIDRALALQGHTPAEVAQLYPPYPDAPRRSPQRPAYDAAERAVLTRLGHGMRAVPSLLGSGDGVGSNAWVVDGRHSATGEPLLANDPHLAVSLPGVWMQMGLHCRTVSRRCPLDVSGFTFAGVPGVIIGHNADIAWGFTNLGPDVSDLYLERVRGRRWRYDGHWRPLREHTEHITVDDGDDVTLRVRSTADGPLLSDVSDDLAAVGENPPGVPSGRYAVALKWTALTPRPTADAILALDTATDWRSFRRAAARFDVPAQSMLYADREGHIGYQAPGRIPIRRPGNDGMLPAVGWRPRDGWTGRYVPFRALPSVLDPKDGFVVSANQAVTGPGYRYRLGTDWDAGYRSQRIRDLLQRDIAEHGTVSVQDMLAIQLDDQNPVAPVLTPYLLRIRLPRGYWSAGQRLLRGWDFRQDADSGAAAYFNVVWSNLLARTFHDDLPEDLWPDGGQRWYAVVTRLLREPHSTWWDDKTTDGVVETRDDILADALRDARDEITRREALRPGEWTWGRLHQLDLRNQTLGESGVGIVEWLLDRGGWGVDGGSGAVDAASWDAAEGYGVTTAPSMRMVVSLADLDDSRWVNLTGVSGHPFDDHYTDQTGLWVAGDTLPWRFSRDAVEDAAQDVLTLEPVSGTR